ncbi:hypothetical protein E4U42_004445 [Claviceps africana]|uniref:Phospholipase/carboxylesterase/thioesterase domain-containing protein n=1 Tax=Claviceps africana TaxID=83212 RepID=A0A8K0J5E6_9HYPO|nr:hypothetical protein E4U42_004445 [Claviceps africana]
MPPRIPTQADLTPLLPLHVTMQPPSPPESTTSLLILLHGLGDSEAPFSAFARNMSLPGVLCLSVRGPSLLPPSLLDDEDTRGGYHWGDDVQLDSSTGEIDPDPGFSRAERLIMDGLVRGVLVGECGWDMCDVLVFGFGQGGSLALGMGVGLPAGDSGRDARDVFKGIVSVGGPLPRSMLRRGGAASEKSRTHVLLCQVGGEEEVDVVRREFANVSVVRWRREGVSMPRDRDEMFPLMKFFAERLRSGGW